VSYTAVPDAYAGDLPTLPDIALKVLELAGSDEASARQIEDALQRDQALAARVLRMSNSAYYAMRGTVSTLSHAVVILGTRALRTVVLAACSESLCQHKRSSFKDRTLWRHSVASGIAARFIARRCRYAMPEEAFVAGLLHDIGKLVLDVNHREQYKVVVQRAFQTGESFLEIEREVFGFDHAQIGALVARKWDLAVRTREAIEWHHEPDRATVDPSLADIVSLANMLCVKLAIGPEQRPDLDVRSLPSIARLCIPVDELDGLLETAKARIEAERVGLEA
jgi:putative nucleotidyltransferase with HDIG domain